MGSDYGSGSGGMGGYGSGSGGMGSGSDGENPVDMGPGSESGFEGYGSGTMGPGSGSGSEDPVNMGSGSESGFEGYGSGTMGPGSGSGSEDPVNMGSGSENEDPVTMGPGSGSGSGSGSSSGASCPEAILMDKCDIDCRDSEPEPSTMQSWSSSQVGSAFQTSWTILANNPVPKITWNCPGAPTPFVTECKDGGWTIPEEIQNFCFDGGMEGHGSGSGEDGMMDHGSGSGSGEDGMMDHGSSSGSEDG